MASAHFRAGFIEISGQAYPDFIVDKRGDWVIDKRGPAVGNPTLHFQHSVLTIQCTCLHSHKDHKVLKMRDFSESLLLAIIHRKINMKVGLNILFMHL